MYLADRMLTEGKIKEHKLKLLRLFFLLQVANHMLGSVLCRPGCFSLYRCQAVRDVLPTYATGVDHAFDFLTKDMGE